MTHYYNKGHKVIIKEPEQEQSHYYEDTGEKITNKTPERPCNRCNHFPNEDGTDYCLGMLPGVEEACCGHGIDDESYILFENGTYIQKFVVNEKYTKLFKK